MLLFLNSSSIKFLIPTSRDVAVICHVMHLVHINKTGCCFQMRVDPLSTRNAIIHFPLDLDMLCLMAFRSFETTNWFIHCTTYTMHRMLALLAAISRFVGGSQWCGRAVAWYRQPAAGLFTRVYYHQVTKLWVSSEPASYNRVDFCGVRRFI